MLSSDQSYDEENDVFFDSEDLSPARSLVASEEYKIWMYEPPSVKERRESFLRKMDLVEFDSTKFASVDTGLERVSECSGASPSSCISPSSRHQANFMYNTLDSNIHGSSNLAWTHDAVHIASPSATGSARREAEAPEKEYQNSQEGEKKTKVWWKQFINKRKRRGGKVVSKVSKPDTEIPKQNRMKVKQNGKKCMEFTALYSGQEILAHKGFIGVMKFSPNGQYVATGGEDGIVCIWRVTLADASCTYLTPQGNFDSKLKKMKSGYHVIFPEKGFRIQESPLQEFHGHSSDVLDLAWSSSNYLLSSSMDKTVRLWDVSSGHCLNVFDHNDYVTCIQFNPVNDNYFISGSIDGKVRVWGLSDNRVADWADVRDVITAICYQPDGKGFVVGSVTGTCHFYEVSGDYLQLVVRMRIHGRKKTSGNQITGIKFCQEKSQRVMITSEDSKVRIFDGVELIRKYKGLAKSGSQTSASFTSSGKHIISVGEDSRVYLWDYDEHCVSSSSKQTKSVQSCEHFLCEGVSVAVPWPGMRREQRSLETQGHLEAAPGSRDSQCFSLGNWFFLNGPCRGGSATWPEEKLHLPLWDLPVIRDENGQHHRQRQVHHRQQQQQNKALNRTAESEPWGLVIVTAGCDGTIRTFHNYGLPVRL
ncbi:WD repeat-containing protein-like [Pyrus ussuriensis x Pyrus communis]|uniref:WD repeat-containing protein-like n=1 Tax=Pyrus ussuriensis x Pyrus communis TaxID=2448454 RepID=A0A5N5F2P6_9ROSA|nr:uncharacterized WD repeat-containing protein C3H5.08c-like [Pyrus x bretschneideri]KAB2597247.1 WD repeat-containing protein-like [Pyrus ussuriensis x Pyrus communis]